MKLFLASRAKDPRTVESLKKYMDGFKGKTIVYIPTAANAEDGWESWKSSETWNMIRKFESVSIPIQLEDYRNKSVVKEIERISPDVIWFGGGYPGYLAYWMRRCSLDRYLPEILGEKGLYFGSSAGAMVAGVTLQIATFGFVDNERGAGDITPMNFVNFDIFPHYSEKYLDKIKQKYCGKKLYLLKDGEELIIEGDKITLIGEERIIING